MPLNWAQILGITLLGAFSAWFAENTRGLNLYQDFTNAYAPFRQFPPVPAPDLTKLHQYYEAQRAGDVVSVTDNHTANTNTNTTGVDLLILAQPNDTFADDNTFQRDDVPDTPTLFEALVETFWQLLVFFCRVNIHFNLLVYHCLEQILRPWYPASVTFLILRQEMEQILDRMMGKVEEYAAEEKIKALEALNRQLKDEHEKTLQRMDAKRAALIWAHIAEVEQLKKRVRLRDGLIEENGKLVTTLEQTAERNTAQIKSLFAENSDKSKQIYELQTENRRQKKELENWNKHSIDAGWKMTPAGPRPTVNPQPPPQPTHRHGPPLYPHPQPTPQPRPQGPPFNPSGAQFNRAWPAQFPPQGPPRPTGNQGFYGNPMFFGH